MIRILSFILVLGLLIQPVAAQKILVPADSLNASRVHSAIVIGGLTYTGFSIGLYNAWYKKYDQTSFHLFDDLYEWNQMDKVGHVHSAYFQGIIAYKGMRWAGVSKKKSLLTGIITGTLFQGTIEVMDGFSTKWGFSLGDMAANIAGTSVFALQQHYWNEQRIHLKMSSIPIHYSKTAVYATDKTGVSTLYKRAQELYGNTFYERFLKDYNAQVYWASFDVHSFLPEDNIWPKWLNLALGYGAGNMYGGFDNSWMSGDHMYVLNPQQYPRYRRFFIGPDLNLTSLNTKRPFLKTVFSALNVFRIPSPAIEINTRGELIFHLLR